MDIGCETGKNAAYLIQAGHRVALLDVVANAIEHTISNLKKLQLDHEITDQLIGYTLNT